MKTLDLYSLAMLLVSIGLWTKLENLVPNQSSPSIPESVLEQLAIQCGTPYMRAVKACWNAVEQEHTRPNASEEVLSQVQLRANRYLEACCILDGVSGLDERLGEEISTQPSASQSRTKTASSSYSTPVYRPPVAEKSDVKLPIAAVPTPPSGIDIKKPLEGNDSQILFRMLTSIHNANLDNSWDRTEKGNSAKGARPQTSPLPAGATTRGGNRAVEQHAHATNQHGTQPLLPKTSRVG